MPLILHTNRGISQGFFNRELKRADILPICKMGDHMLVYNYRYYCWVYFLKYLKERCMVDYLIF